MNSPIRSKRTKLAALVAGLAALILVATAAAAPIVNGDFQTGDFTGWTTFTTPNGTIGTPAVVSFDTTGSGASLAARFEIGTTVGPTPGPREGGGIFQVWTPTAGIYNLSADIATLNNNGGNADCGLFELLVDGAVVASHNFGGCGGPGVIVRAVLNAPSLALSGAPHELRVRITRAFFPAPMFEYVDNIKLVASCAGLNATISGSGTLVGTPGNDVIVGGPGNDTIMGGGGNDTICGGQGNDTIFGDGGADTLYGDDGIAGDPAGGRDTVFGGDGNDSIEGEAGNDSLYGGANDDVVRGGLDYDSVLGEAGNDDVHGGAGKDALDGGTGNDTLSGGAGDDVLSGQAGNDTLNGDLGPTPPGTLDPAANLDSCSGGAGTDTAIFCEAQISIP